jgi:uncharacterized protein (TIGR00255 family)
MSDRGAPYAIRSMTGFARASAVVNGVAFDMEARSVNHRFFEVVFKAPRWLGSLERDLKGVFLKRHRRGRLEVSLVRRAATQDSGVSEVEDGRFDATAREYLSLCKRYGVSSDGLGGVLASLILKEGQSAGEPSELLAIESECVLALAEGVCAGLLESRLTEGGALACDVAARLSTIDALREAIAAEAASAPVKLKARLLERVGLLAPEVRLDPERLALEVALLADRVDVSEELSRLKIHLAQFRAILTGSPEDGVGRKLDFTTQEIGRELNTIGSKAQDAVAQGYVVEAKAELERIREQVQNIE